jgi:hypothetical protein
VHAGFAFDFTTDPAHERFVARQLTRYVTLVQQRLQRVG